MEPLESESDILPPSPFHPPEPYRRWLYPAATPPPPRPPALHPSIYQYHPASLPNLYPPYPAVFRPPHCPQLAPHNPHTSCSCPVLSPIEETGEGSRKRKSRHDSDSNDDTDGLDKRIQRMFLAREQARTQLIMEMIFAQQKGNEYPEQKGHNGSVSGSVSVVDISHSTGMGRFQAPRDYMAPQQLGAVVYGQDVRHRRAKLEQLASVVANRKKTAGLENSHITTVSSQNMPIRTKAPHSEEEAAHLPPKSIRLLKLLYPTNDVNHNTTGSVRIPKYSANDFPYSDHPKYIALSYVWGTEDATSLMCVNGENVQVRTNLTHALSVVEKSNPDAYLWADAICINQQDDKEKSILVQRMGEIFANAELVYAWLGPVEKATPHTSSDDLFTHLSNLGTLFWQHAGSDEAEKLNERALDLKSILSKSLDALFAQFAYPPQQGGFPPDEYSIFSARPYWSRIWVLQEVYLAKSLHYLCGNSRLPSRTLQGALILLETFQQYLVGSQGPVREQLKSNTLLGHFALGNASYPEMHRLNIYTSIYPREVISLRIAMTNYCVKKLPGGSRSTDPRDMIYGLLGFANEQEKLYIRADYSKSVQDTYTAVTRSMMEHGFTDILAWAQPENKRLADLPSWVPDYASTICESMCSQGQAKPWLPQFSAGGWTSYIRGNEKPFGHGVLPVYGRCLGQVLSVGQLWLPRSSAGPSVSSPMGQGSGDAFPTRSASYDELLFFLTETMDLACYARTIQNGLVTAGKIILDVMPSFEQTAWRVPCCTQTVQDGKLSRSFPSARHPQLIHVDTFESLQACVREPGRELPASSRCYVEAMLRWVNKRPFLTENGFVGLGPAGVEPGDTVAILDGFSACYVLRRCSDRPVLNRYQLVGEAYIHGVENGEMASSSSPDTGEWIYLV